MDTKRKTEKFKKHIYFYIVNSKRIWYNEKQCMKLTSTQRNNVVVPIKHS